MRSYVAQLFQQVGACWCQQSNSSNEKSDTYEDIHGKRSEPYLSPLSACTYRPVKDLIEEIKSGNGLRFAPGKLRELCKLLPDEGEVLVMDVLVVFFVCLLCPTNLVACTALTP